MNSLTDTITFAKETFEGIAASGRRPNGWQWLVGVVLIVLVVGLFLPARVIVERGIIVDAHKATVFALANDFRQREKWSPIATNDANARVEFSGPRRGAGATIRWESEIVGHGSETIVESDAAGQVNSIRSMDDGTRIQSVLTLAALDKGTQVRWSLERNFGLNIPGRFYGLLLDGITGPQQEESLDLLADLAAAMPSADFTDLVVEEISVDALDIAYLRTTSMPLASAISDAMGDAYFEVLNFIDAQGYQEAGPPISITRTFSGSELVFDAGIPILGKGNGSNPLAGNVKVGTTYVGKVIRVQHVGSYSELNRTHDKIAAYLAAMGIARNGDVWESYVSDPTRTSTAELVTEIYYPVQN